MIRWNNEELNNFYAHKFDFDNQIKSTYTDWIVAFQNSIRKCASNGCFMGLSSGYDSGATSYEMSKQGIHFKAYTTLNGENEQVIKERLKYIPEKRANFDNAKIFCHDHIIQLYQIALR